MHPYARSVLDNWLKFFIGKRGFVRYRGLEMAQSCRMLTNIAQCVIQQWSYCAFHHSIALNLLLANQR